MTKVFRSGWHKSKPDVLCLQETKLQPEQYPAEALDALGYKHYLYSAQKKGYSGVAILSKQEPDHVEYGMGIEEYDNEGRFIRADFGDVSVVSVYHPSVPAATNVRPSRWSGWRNSREYVLELERTRPNLILCGDYNICHEAIDIHDPVRNATNSGFCLKSGVDDTLSQCGIHRFLPLASSRQAGIHVVELSL